MKVVLKAILLTLVMSAPVTSVYAYENCQSYLGNIIQDKSPLAKSQIGKMCATYSPDSIDCAAAFRNELPSLMATPATFLMGLEVCAQNTHQVIMCTGSTLQKGPRNAPITVLEKVVKYCQNNT